MSSEVGALDEDAVNRVFRTGSTQFDGLCSQGGESVELLGGDVAIFVGINAQGKGEDVRLERSTMGDRDTEACMIQVFSERHWPKPVGGRKGQVHKSFSFDMPNDARPPVEWTAEDVEGTLGKFREHTVEECTGGGSGTCSDYSLHRHSRYRDIRRHRSARYARRIESGLLGFPHQGGKIQVTRQLSCQSLFRALRAAGQILHRCGKSGHWLPAPEHASARPSP